MVLLGLFPDVRMRRTGPREASGLPGDTHRRIGKNRNIQFPNSSKKRHVELCSVTPSDLEFFQASSESSSPPHLSHRPMGPNPSPCGHGVTSVILESK